MSQFQKLDHVNGTKYQENQRNQTHNDVNLFINAVGQATHIFKVANQGREHDIAYIPVNLFLSRREMRTALGRYSSETLPPGYFVIPDVGRNLTVSGNSFYRLKRNTAERIDGIEIFSGEKGKYTPGEVVLFPRNERVHPAGNPTYFVLGLLSFLPRFDVNELTPDLERKLRDVHTGEKLWGNLILPKDI